MFDFHEKRKLKKICYSKPVVGFLLLLVIFFGIQVWGVFSKDHTARERKAEVAASYDELLERQDSLKEEIERLSTERGVEEAVRTKFDVAKPGEEVIVIVEPKDDGLENSKKRGGVFDWFFDLF